MILGLGMDLVSLPRMERCLTRFGDHFLDRILTGEERRALPAAAGSRAAHVAGRFAAKEAAVKALGTGFADGIGVRDVEVISLPSGQPELRFHGAAARRAEAMGVTAAHVSLSHERDVAGAVVVLEG